MPIKQIAAQATDATLLDRLINAEPEDREPLDIRLALQSALGSAMFSGAAEQSSFQNYSHAVQGLVDGMLDKEVISEDDIATYYEAARLHQQRQQTGET